MFSSIDYIGKFVEHFVAAMDAAEDGVAAYKMRPPTDPYLLSDYQPIIKQWENKVLPNFRGMRMNALEALKDINQGDDSTIEDCTGNLRGLSKDMDGIGEEWWQVVDQMIKDKYFSNLGIAKKMGANIYYTLAKYWDPGEIFDEEITGPIDEQELLKYLKPGESV